MKPQKPPKKKRFVSQEVQYFSKFIGKYSILALAIGTILGQVSKDVVDTLVTGIISPAISLMIPSKEFGEWRPQINGVEFLVGEFFDALIQMLVTMVVIYITVRYLFRKLDLLGLDKGTAITKGTKLKK